MARPLTRMTLAPLAIPAALLAVAGPAVAVSDPAPRLVTTASVDATARAKVGDILTYTLTVRNDGDGRAYRVDVADAVPQGTAYVRGSLAVGGEGRSDAADGDRAETDGTTVRFRVGEGTAEPSGGWLGPGASAVVSFQVKVAERAAGGWVENSAHTTYFSPLREVTKTGESNVTRTEVAAVEQAVAVRPTAGPEPSPEATTLVARPTPAPTGSAQQTPPPRKGPGTEDLAETGAPRQTVTVAALGTALALIGGAFLVVARRRRG
ncbi:LPXTG cell wall anchor domain-containing protein [Streptomyces sp. NPDC048659]|uniref:LPXTG cell wall anchor domain-containing protein n=1 Tax=Streptomyces sp. NPDC048659 TaxID=3155489 RepID=UPI0034343C24